MRWLIRRGGGFWCRPGGHGGVVRLVRTRASWSELRTAGRSSGLSGQLTAALPRERGEFRVTGGRWAVEARRVGGGIRVGLAGSGRVVGTARTADGRVRLRFRSGPAGIRGHAREIEVALPAIGNPHVSLWATSRSDATFDLAHLKLSR
jgi:hypothetical protein